MQTYSLPLDLLFPDKTFATGFKPVRGVIVQNLPTKIDVGDPLSNHFFQHTLLLNLLNLFPRIPPY